VSTRRRGYASVLDSRNSVRRCGPPSAQATATRSPMSMRSVTAPPARNDPLDLVGQCHRCPHPAFGVERDAVGRPVQAVGENPPVTQPVVVTDGECAQPSASRLGDDQCLSVRRDHHSVGEVEVFGDDGGAVVGIEVDDHATRERLASDTGPPRVVDDHIAEVGRRQVGEIGDGDQSSAHTFTKHRKSVTHRGHRCQSRRVRARRPLVTKSYTVSADWVRAVSDVVVTIPNSVSSLCFPLAYSPVARLAGPEPRQASFTNPTQSVTLSRELLSRETGWI